MPSYAYQELHQCTGYFREGPGAFYVRHLATGSAGNVSLVRFANTKELAARKEDFVEDIAGNALARPEDERVVYHRLVHIPGVVRLLGWCEYTRCTVGTEFRVTYSSYCNLGTMTQLIGRAETQETLAAMHSAGVMHQDLHGSNIFLDRKQLTDDPTALIGDLGASVIRSDTRDCASQDWAGLCKEDYVYLADSCKKLCELTTPGALIYYMQKFVASLRSSPSNAPVDTSRIARLVTELKWNAAREPTPDPAQVKLIFEHTVDEKDEP